MSRLLAGADLGGGGGGGGRPFPSGIRPPADPKGPTFDTFSEIHFWRIDPKIFLKAPLAPIYTNFEGERAPKKTRFFCQNFSKSAQNRGKTVLWESSKNQFGRPKKKKGRQNFGKFFENPPPPPRENPRSAPGALMIHGLSRLTVLETFGAEEFPSSQKIFQGWKRC